MSAVERLDAIDTRTNAASRGQWFVALAGSRVDEGGERFNVEVQRFTPPDDHDIVADLGPSAYFAESSPDAEFIAAARSDVPVMATALRAILALHVHENSDGGCCAHDGEPFPCATVRIIETELAR